MSGYMSKSKNDSQNTSGNNFNQDVWQPQGDALGGMYKQLGQMFGGMTGGGQQQNNFGRDFGQAVMGDQRQGAQDAQAGGVYQNMGLQKQLTDSLAQSQGQPSNMQDINSMIMGGAGNNYADAMKNNFMQDANRAQEQMLGNLDARAAASGMSGGARQGVAQAQGMQDINQNLQQNMANVGFSAFDKDLDRKLGIAQQADQNNFGRQQLMSNMLGQQQQAQNQGMRYGQNLVGQSQGQQMMPWQQAGAYGGILGAPTVLGSGSGFGQGSASGKGFATGGGMGGGGMSGGG